ncbi:MAG: type IV toxin-antitoxin system AbiEi family antitoxin [Prevotellaceae bacterium]|jgi:predicted transcriptional regulator of viral defense system|nr:type IV toxin-antitoxin system AbiEi family antitoxin [Prevotellaceae bacterium]
MTTLSNISHWVDDLPKLGKTTFTRQEIVAQFTDMASYNIQNTLYRLSKKKKIQSVWRDFYAVILPEYGLQGIIPPMAYIDKLMKFLGKEYYVGLLSAAALQGASHQVAMEFFVITNSECLRDKQKNNIKINFVTKKHIPQQLVSQITVNSGYVNVSCPEMTAFDLLIYEKNVGGINRVATVLSELAENLDFDNIPEEFLKSIGISIIQRMGYLLDLLEHEDLSDQLMKKSQKAGITFRKYPLSALSEKRNFADFEINDKWKIIINKQIETDDL